LRRIIVAPPKRKFCRESASAIAFAELILVLHQGDWSREEILEQTGIADSTFRGWMRYLKSRNLIYISEYRRTARTGAPRIIYSWNHYLESSDVKKPAPKTQSEYSKTYRRNKALRIFYEQPKNLHA
jgi:transcription initiation factor IIE alpha subunit